MIIPDNSTSLKFGITISFLTGIIDQVYKEQHNYDLKLYFMHHFKK